MRLTHSQALVSSNKIKQAQPELPAAGCICPAVCAPEPSSPVLPAATQPRSLLKPSKSTGGSLSPPQTVPPASMGSHQEPHAHGDTLQRILATPTPTSEAIAFALLARRVTLSRARARLSPERRRAQWGDPVSSPPRGEGDTRPPPPGASRLLRPPRLPARAARDFLAAVPGATRALRGALPGHAGGRTQAGGSGPPGRGGGRAQGRVRRERGPRDRPQAGEWGDGVPGLRPEWVSPRRPQDRGSRVLPSRRTLPASVGREPGRSPLSTPGVRSARPAELCGRARLLPGRGGGGGGRGARERSPRPRAPGPARRWRPPQRSFVTSGGRGAASRAGLTRRRRRQRRRRRRGGGGLGRGGSMEPRAGCRLPVRVEQVVNGALVVTVSCGERSFAGILLDCTKKSGLFGLPPSALLPQVNEPPANNSHGRVPEGGDAEVMQLGPGSPPPPHGVQPPETTGPEPPPPLVPPLPAGSLPPYPPYFEGAPFPHPLWLRDTYKLWVPQPPPRTIKRTRRRLSRNRDPGRLILSTIRLRPRQVLCEKCKSTLSPLEASPGPPAAPRARRRLGSGPDRELRKPEEPENSDPMAGATARRSKRERREEDRAPAEQVPRSPVIKISYSTPQGKGEVVKIPSRVHGSLEPFRPQQAPQDDGSLDPEVLDRESRDRPSGAPSASIPKLKLTRPVPPSADLPPP
ncbi:hypothetical protein H8959_011243 [Pygathrix nigripes]